MALRIFSHSFVGLVLSTLLAANAHAVTLTATAVDLPDVVSGQDVWRFDYTLVGPLAVSNGVNLTFPFADFNGLAVVTAPASDVAYALSPPHATSNIDGLLTLTALADLTPTYTTSFSVSFTKVTGNAFGPQSFEVFDDSFGVIDSGTLTATLGPPLPVPEPSSAALLLLGVAAVAGAQWRRSKAV